MVERHGQGKAARLRLVNDAVKTLEAMDAASEAHIDLEQQRVDRVLAAHGKLAYSVAEAAKALSVSQWYIRDEIRQGHLSVIDSRGRKIIPAWELLRYMEDNLSVAPSKPAPDPADEELVQKAVAILREGSSGYRTEPQEGRKQSACAIKPSPAAVKKKLT